MIQFKTPNHNRWEAEISKSDTENHTYRLTRVYTDNLNIFGGAASFDEQVPVSVEDQERGYLLVNAACLYERKERYGE